LALNAAMAFTDIRLDLVNTLPSAARPYALLMRLDRPIGWWLLLLPGWWAIALAGGGVQSLSADQWALLGLFFIGAIVMRGAGCVVNDLWDTRSRPLASGQVTVKQALIFTSMLLLIGLGILYAIGSWLVFWLAALSLSFVVAYPYMKRITWWPQAFLGLTFNFGVPIGWAATAGVLQWPALLLYAGAFFWTLGYDTIYAHQDKEDDEVVGIKSTALLFGRRSKEWIGAFYLVSWGLITAGAFLATESIVTYVLLVLPAIHLILQILIWDPESQESSLKTFKSNQVCGLLFFLAFLCA
jgi:4-hydroxybenzoate polyprenyltransferase